MQLTQITSRLMAILLCVSAVSPFQAGAADKFPVRPVQLIIPFAPGDTDSMLRPITDRMGEFLDQPVVMSYKPGAGGAIGAALVASSKPDGYTVVGTSAGSIVVAPLANKDLKYTLESFTPVASISAGGFLFVVKSDSPFKSLADLANYSKQNPGKISYSSSGSLGITHLLAEILSKEAALEWNHIPYQGGGPAIAALLGGHVDFSSTAIGSSQTNIKAEKLRALAVIEDARLKVLPDVPTLKELGYQLGSPALYGILVPKGTPQEVVDTLYGAVKKVFDKYGDQISEALTTIGAEPKLLGPVAYSEYLKAQSALFAGAVKAASK